MTTLGTFHLNTVMLVIAGIAILLGIWHESPVLAYWLAIPAIIAFVRTIAGSKERDSWINHVVVYTITFVKVIGVAFLGFVAFFATCTAITVTGSGPYGGNNFGAGLVIGGIVGLAVIIGLTILIAREGRRATRRQG